MAVNKKPKAILLSDIAEKDLSKTVAWLAKQAIKQNRIIKKLTAHLDFIKGCIQDHIDFHNDNTLEELIDYLKKNKLVKCKA